MAMEGVKTFLESSTIHGLNYISTTRKFSRILWVIIVISGFIGAGVLIYESFDDWSENPVDTTIETYPIHMIRFPKVTVCPPKNTYTSLNHDIMAVGNMTIDYDTLGYKLLENFVKFFQQKDFDEIMEYINTFEEKDKFRNWYKQINLVPFWLKKNHKKVINDVYMFNYMFRNALKSHATSGHIATHHLGERFEVTNFELVTEYSVTIIVPYDVYNEKAYGNTTYRINYDIEGMFECIRIQSLGNNHECIDPNKNELIIEESNDVDGIRIIFTRKFDELDFENWKAKRITGFSVNWVFFSHETKVSQDLFEEENKFYTRMANYIHKSGISPKDIWNVVRQQKADWMASIIDPATLSYGISKYSPDYRGTVADMYDLIFKDIGKKLNETAIDIPLYNTNITDENLMTAAEMFLYIMTPHQDYWSNFHRTYSTLLQQCSLRRLLGEIFKITKLIRLINIPFPSLASVAIGAQAMKQKCKRVLADWEPIKCEDEEVTEVKGFIFEDLSREFNLSSYQYNIILTSSINFLQIDQGDLQFRQTIVLQANPLLHIAV